MFVNILCGLLALGYFSIALTCVISELVHQVKEVKEYDKITNKIINKK